LQCNDPALLQRGQPSGAQNAAPGIVHFLQPPFIAGGQYDVGTTVE
jgi:hypothetical protein